MSVRDIERLLKDACRSPLGPLSVAVTKSGADAWSLEATWHDRVAALSAVYEPQTAGLQLLRLLSEDAADPKAVAAMCATRPWVIDAAPAEGSGVSVRLWLHGDDLDMNTFLSAVAELARLDLIAGGAPVADSAVEEPQTEPLSPAEPAPASAQEPEIEAPRPSSWQTLVAVEPAEPAPTNAPEQSSQVTDTDADPDGTKADSPPLEGAVAGTGTQPESGAGEATQVKGGYCRECGAPHPGDHVFCTNCGARLN